MHAEERRAVAAALLQILDRPVRRSEIPPKAVVLECLGLPKAGKTALIRGIDQFFRRNGWRVYTPAEGAEISAIRSLSNRDKFIFQTRHLVYALENVIDSAHNKTFHVVIIDRGIVDTLVWLERGVRRREFSNASRSKMRDYILAGAWMNMIDCFCFFICDVDVALAREQAFSLSEEPGQNMNQENLLLFTRDHETALDDLSRRLPNLPILRINTTGKKPVESTAEAIDGILMILKKRFALQESQILPRSVDLLRDRLSARAYQELQLKLREWPSESHLSQSNWHAIAATTQEDTYLRPKEGSGLEPDELLRIRKEGDAYCFAYYRSQPVDSISGVRAKVILPLASEDVPIFMAAYDHVAVVKKVRRIYVRAELTLMLDEVEGLGKYAELHVAHTDDMPNPMTLAAELGFREADIVRESYLRMISKKQKPSRPS